MNKYFTRKEFDALPYRDEMTVDPRPGEVYKSRDHKSVWVAIGNWPHNPHWDCFGADIAEERPNLHTSKR